jgi:hypothetical protein
MLRFIIKNKQKNAVNGAETEEFFTHDIENEELESILKHGGFSEDGYEYNQLVGVEIKN